LPNIQRYAEAEDCYQQAVDLNITNAAGALSSLYFETNQIDKKAAALSLALRAVAENPSFVCLYTLASVALWNNEIDTARETIEKILSTESWQQDFTNEEAIIDLLVLLLAKGQTNLFDKWQQQFDLADKLKPLYYAFLNLAPEKYPDQLLRMGSELKETVEEILEKIAAYKERYK